MLIPAHITNNNIANISVNTNNTNMNNNTNGNNLLEKI